MPYPLCRHIHTNGAQCQSPAITGGLHCYHHQLVYRRHAGYRHTDATRGYLVRGQHIELAAIEDRASIQLAISLVINALATGQIEIKRATAILYGLQIASSNAATLSAFTPDVVLTVQTSPEGLDLAQPGATTEDDEEDLFDEDEEEDEEDEEGDESEEEDAFASSSQLDSSKLTAHETRPSQQLEEEQGDEEDEEDESSAPTLD
jgi:hypothetical protein